MGKTYKDQRRYDRKKQFRLRHDDKWARLERSVDTAKDVKTKERNTNENAR